MQSASARNMRNWPDNSTQNLKTLLQHRAHEIKKFASAEINLGTS